MLCCRDLPCSLLDLFRGLDRLGKRAALGLKGGQHLLFNGRSTTEARIVAREVQ